MINLLFLIKPFFSIWPKSQDKNLNILRTRRAFKMKQKAFFNNFQELSVAKSCLRPATWFSISAIKRGLFIKSFLLNIVARVWKFQLLLIWKSSKLSLYSLLKNMLKIPILDLNKRSLFFQILPYIQSVAILVSQGCQPNVL